MILVIPQAKSPLGSEISSALKLGSANNTKAGWIAAKLRPDSVTAKAALTSFSYTAPALLLTLPGEETLIFAWPVKKASLKFECFSAVQKEMLPIRLVWARSL